MPLFPTFALISHYAVGGTRSALALQSTALFGLWSLAPYATYLFSVYWLSTRVSLMATLSAATLVWLVCAGLMLLLWYRAYPSVA